jgi:CRP-like cAMP-binding protein
LPINAIRLRQMLNLVKKARVSARGDLSMDWLRPFMSPRKYPKGDVLFHKGDVAKEMFLTVTGKFLVTEIGVELPPGRMMGELGFVDPKNRRTQTVECIEDGDVLTITYEKLLELYFQNPEFGYYFLRLTTERLMQNISRLEGIVEADKRDISRLEGLVASRKAASQ